MYSEKNRYVATVYDGEKVIDEIECLDIDAETNMTVVNGIPQAGGEIYRTTLATIPTRYIVKLRPLNPLS